MNNIYVYRENESFYRGKNILLTGSVGTVGSELLKQVINCRPAEVRLFDNNESGLFMQMQKHAANKVKLIPILGDIRDYGKLRAIIEGVDIVFHLAAFKHVTLCESNPFDSIRTNVVGTQNVLKAALAANVGRVIYTSSDKAVNPTNVMGTSKLLAERVVTASSISFWNGCKRRAFSSTRFGNVLGSNGSVIPIFREQIKQGGPLTLTHPEMTRFVMTVQEAARLVLRSGVIACGGEVMVTKMPTIRILDLAQALIELLAPRYGYRPEDIDIKHIGPKPGEKLFEELMTESEVVRAVELEDMFAVLPVFKEISPHLSWNYPNFVTDGVKKPYISKTEKLMTVKEIKNFLVDNDIVEKPRVERNSEIQNKVLAKTMALAN